MNTLIYPPQILPSLDPALAPYVLGVQCVGILFTVYIICKLFRP